MKIVTDVAADMSAEELERLDITSAPLFIQFPEGEVSSSDIGADEFYNRLAAMYPAIPSTAQPSGGLFAQIYRQLAEKGEEILSIHISSGLSGTINSARVGAEQSSLLERITHWDTMTLGGGERFQVLAAALAARAGWSIRQIQERLAEIRAQTEVVFTLETLEYLARGGRIGRVQAVAGMLLNIQPVIHVDHRDGRYSTVGRARSGARALAAIESHLHQKYDGTPVWLAVQHGRASERAQALADLLGERLNVAKMEIFRITPVLGVHTGPGIVGAAVVPMELMSDLI